MMKNMTCMTVFKIYEVLKTLSINVISFRKYLVSSLSILKHHKEIIRSSVFTNTKKQTFMCTCCVYLSVHFSFFKETWRQQNTTQAFLFTLFHLIKEKKFFTKKFSIKPKGRILPKKKENVWFSIMKKFTNSPEKNHLVSNIKEIFAKNCFYKWKKDKKKKKKAPEFFFCHSDFVLKITWFCELKK